MLRHAILYALEAITNSFVYIFINAQPSYIEEGAVMCSFVVCLLQIRLLAIRGSFSFPPHVFA